jgi:hypothetical protein
MNRWLDIVLVAAAVFASAGYAVYALGNARVKNAYSRWATKHFGLRVARLFAGSKGGCGDCGSGKSPFFKDRR